MSGARGEMILLTSLYAMGKPSDLSRYDLVEEWQKYSAVP